MKRLLPWTLTALALLTVGAAADLSVKDGAGTTRVIKNFVCESTKLCNATVLIKSDGTEVGISAAPLRFDPTGTTTQPVSGTFWPYTIGQQLSAASVPVVLPAAQITTLTPPAAITGFATSVKQSDGTQKTQIVDGSGNVIAATSNNLNVQCANCSGSGVSTADAATFTASTSLFAGTGGFFQTTATANPLTNGQQGMWQMTANRAGFVNLRNASGAELGVAAAPLQVSLANHAANATAVKVDGSAVTQPVSLASVPSHAVTNAGTFATQAAVTAASGSFSSGAFASGSYASGAFSTGSMVDLLTMRGTVAAGTAAANSLLTSCIYNSTPITLTNGQGAAVQCSANGYPTVVVSNTNNNGQAALGSSSPVAIAKNSGTGSTVAGAAVGTAGAASAEVITVQGVASMTPVQISQATASNLNAAVVGTGTAGSAAGGVLTVQGVASMTPFLANPGTAANWGVGATAAAVPASANYIGFNSGGNLTGPSTSTPLPVNQSDGTNIAVLDPCQSAAKTSLPITLATAAVKVIATGVSAKKIYVCAIDITNNAADSVAVFEATTGTTCATSPIAVAGAGTSVATAATGYNFAANGGISKGNGGFQVMQTTVNNNDLCIAQSVATQLTGNITYVTR